MENKLERFETLLAQSQFAVCVLGNSTLDEFELLDLGSEPVPSEVTEDLQRRGLCFIGLMGLGLDGEPRSALAVPIGPSTMRALAYSFFERLEVVRLERMMTLPDTRETLPN